ncbi:Gln-dependent amino transferase [Candidatus Halobonum tyrrellensis G22]|uniref:Putative asparagine synthetase [glutamine-hydrolyzing] n=2 Tax=Candidatus Halobonum TaxID=1431544 RepID=V4H9W0_9EURY|nr:Gln-dependent amino transferase [Candidatus Halobonum tyrrellensis G22]
MTGSIEHEEWYETERFESGGCAIGFVHHGDRDPAGHVSWRDGERAGAVHGVVSNQNGWGLDANELLEAALERPREVVPALDGPFLIACYDGAVGRVVLATDKIGARPCYYTVGDGGVVFGSEVKAPLVRVDDPTVDVAAVGDMVMLGHVWGEKTLVEEVRALPPSTILEHEAGEVERTRYWTPSFEEAEPGDGYVSDLATRYRDAVADMAGTVDGEVGLWLSGGLDSRAMATELERTVGSDGGVDALRTYTYDSNPAAGGNPELAGRVADALGVANQQVPLDGRRFADVMESAIDATDGMVRWNTLLNLSAVHNLDADAPGVVVEAAGQGELLGEHLTRYQFTEFETAAEGLYHRQRALPRETFDDLLDADVDPRAPFERSARESDEPTMRRRMLDAHFRNHYARFVLASNPMARRAVGTRTPFANGAFLDHVAGLPTAYRMGTVPLTDGSVPNGASEPKLLLSRTLNPELAAIPYERTRLPPRYPYPAHVGGFVVTTGLRRLVDRATDRNRSLGAVWYRTDPDLRTYVDDLLCGAGERPFFDPETIRDLRREHLAGEANHVSALASVSTVEAWLRNHVDGREATTSRHTTAART